MSELPPDLQTFADALDRADGAAEALASRLDDEGFFWQPDEGRRWSVALCLDHLTVANTVYGASMRTAVDRARAAGWSRRAPARPGFFGRQFANSLEPPVTRRMRAPRKIIPRPITSRDEILRSYRDAHDRLRKLLADSAAIDVNRAKFRNPFIHVVRVRISTAFNVIAAHDRRHLWQAEQVEKDYRIRNRFRI